MKFSSKFLFAYDSLERADLKAEFIDPIPPQVFRWGDTSCGQRSGYFPRKIVNNIKFINGYCGMLVGVAVNGVLDRSMDTSTYKLIFSNLKPWETKHTRRDLANPDAKIGAAAIAGEGAKTNLGISALAEVVLIGEILYKRMTLKDVGRKGSKGLSRQSKNRLVWFLKPIGSPSQDILNSLLEKVL